MATQLQPYLFFYGRCEEALEFYKDVFGGTYELMRSPTLPWRATCRLIQETASCTRRSLPTKSRS